MGSKIPRTRAVTGTEAQSYLKKASEFYLTMLDAYRQERWNAAGLAGVHCAISATDALLGKVGNVRSAEQDHHQVLSLMKQVIRGDEYRGSLDTQIKRLERILSRKHDVEYESREFRASEADVLVKDVGRYFEWVKGYFL